MKVFNSIILTFSILLGIQATAQTSFNPVESTIEFDKAQRPCLSVNLDPEPKTLKKAWRDYLKDNYDFKLKGIGFLRNKDLLSAEEIVVEELSSSQMDFYTKVIENESGSEMSVFVRYGYDIYISKSTHPDQFIKLKSMMEGFMKQYLPTYYAGQLKDTEKRVEELEEETEDLNKEISKDEEEIEKLQEEIKSLEEDLEANNESLNEAKIKLESRKDKLTRIKSDLKGL